LTIRIGLFDSGVGGFTVLRRVLERHGDIPCVYLGDLARMPYGSKTPSEIRVIAREVVEWLKEQELSALLIACNTTNSLALDIVKQIADVPVFGLIEAASQMVFENRVGVLATPSTVASKTYTKQISALNPDTFVLEQACPAFVPLIETGQLNTNLSRKIAKEYLAPLIDARVESIILGCSHYPLLEELLRELLPPYVRLIDPAVRLSINLDSCIGTTKPSVKKDLSFVNTRFCVTSDPSGFGARVNYWLKSYSDIELVSLQSKACVF
tara:strand:+ start:54126 stop:54929 length:804 start_codon:yes stop_codon:yes gene_type:complete